MNFVSPVRGDPRHAGMPPIDLSHRPLTFFEFWPANLWYAPAAAYWILLGLRYRSFTLPTAANPGLPAGGVSGEAKSEVLAAAGPMTQALIAPYAVIDKGHGPEATAHAFDAALKAIADMSLGFPIVTKPNIGCRGAGVRLSRTSHELRAYIESFPEDAKIMLQRYVDLEGEAGIFYVRFPNSAEGFIPSLTLKYFPYVIGDGKRSLEQLILDDPRAGKVPHIYFKRHQERLKEILPAGTRYRIAFAGNHARGAIFRDGTPLVTPALLRRMDELAMDIKGFYFGRFDVRFADFTQVLQGREFTIIEFNGAGAEFTHFWDPKFNILGAYREMFCQLRLAFEVGAANRARGFKPMGLLELDRLRRYEEKLTRHYPETQ